MIVSFRDDWLRNFFVDDVRSKKIPSDLESRLFRKIQMIDDATTDQDLRVPPSNHFEKLRGHLEGFHSIRINKQWRLIFPPSLLRSYGATSPAPAGPAAPKRSEGG
jgi:proteic killer suppression protein